jgi:hypothetical protein
MFVVSDDHAVAERHLLNEFLADLQWQREHHGGIGRLVRKSKAWIALAEE